MRHLLKNLLPAIFLSHFYLLSCLLFTVEAADLPNEKNVTIDDNDSSIVYSGSWMTSEESPLDFGNTHELSESELARAVFTFTGVAVYMLSPKWPYNVTTAVSIDNGPQTIVNLIDSTREGTDGGPETLPYAVVWSEKGLQNTSHTVVVQSAGNYAIVDGFIFTQIESDTEDSASTSSSSSPTDSEVSTSTSDGSTNNRILVIVLPVVFGVLAFILLIAAIIFLQRRRRQAKLASAEDHSHWDKSAFAPGFSSSTRNLVSPPLSSALAPVPSPPLVSSSSYPSNSSPYDYASIPVSGRSEQPSSSREHEGRYQAEQEEFFSSFYSMGNDSSSQPFHHPYASAGVAVTLTKPTPANSQTHLVRPEDSVPSTSAPVANPIAPLPQVISKLPKGPTTFAGSHAASDPHHHNHQSRAPPVEGRGQFLTSQGEKVAMHSRHLVVVNRADDSHSSSGGTVSSSTRTAPPAYEQ